jgi:hypothetical protein
MRSWPICSTPDEGTDMTTSLYAVYLGGDQAPGRMGEDHEVVFVVGEDIKEVRRKARAKWKGVSKPHIDAVQRLDQIDGHAITLVESGEGDSVELDPNYEA